MATVLQDESRGGQRIRGAAGSARRWALSRAGIINVYQYGNETLHFGGGRLLLRGVNGSGKSTAMNMLLPFLLDGDARRIDAAGEQSGVLRAWMLSGREEPQPQGYLWLEVAKGEEYLSFGCGIRASRASEQVSTWWFISSRRPGIDLDLVEGRVPVGREALKALIAPDVVFGQEQRSEYRAELRRRLFGGADIEEHLHLLRIVRNPRVGDRLDTELPQYLQNALPRLSEGALEDAAQPLEDLEEHRRIVTDLKRTAEALDAIQATYRNYARTELHRRAGQTADAIGQFRQRRREEEQLAQDHAGAVERQRTAEEGKRTLDADIAKLRAAIDALVASEAYKSGAQLNDLRALVTRLKQDSAQADDDLGRRRKATERAAGYVRDEQRAAGREHQELSRALSVLADAASGCRVTARPPALVPLTPHPDSLQDLPLAPLAPVETKPAERALAQLAEASRQRGDEVRVVEEAVRRIDPLEHAVKAAEKLVSQARGAQEQATQTLGEMRAAFQTAMGDWQAVAGLWLERLQKHHAAHGLAAPGRPAVLDQVADTLLLGQSVAGGLETLVSPTIDEHQRRRADAQAAHGRQAEAVELLAARAAELAAKQLPDPPLLPWQQRTGRCLAELVDFADALKQDQRSALEAALEASGLLSAEVGGDGSLRLANGQLVVTPATAQAASPLSAWLKADVPKGAAAGLRKAVERILAGISTDLSSPAGTVVTVAGEFRIGQMQGRWSKPEAEHIGVSARRAALERARAEAARQLEEARAEHQRLSALLERTHVGLAEALTLRGEIPSEQPLHTALWSRNEAERTLESAEEQLSARLGELEIATQRHGAAVAHAQDTATRLLLPAALLPLQDIREELRRIVSECELARVILGALAAAVGRWRARGEDWRVAREDEAASGRRLEEVKMGLLTQQERLDTLDARIGASYQQVTSEIQRNETHLRQAQQSLTDCEARLTEAAKQVASTETRRESAADARAHADAQCVQLLGQLRRALAAGGLIEAAAQEPAVPETAQAPQEAHAPRVVFPTVEDSVAGAWELVEAIRAKIPRPQEETSAESVRRSLKARRDSLGAGWDAEDRQPDEQLPLTVEVTGTESQEPSPLPLAAQSVRVRLTRLESLLSAKQLQALRNLLQGLVAREIAGKMHAAGELIERMNERLAAVKTSHGIGVRLRWKQRDDLDAALAPTIALLAKTPDMRTAEEDERLTAALGTRISDARREDPGTPYRELIARVLDYRDWHVMTILLLRPGKAGERLTRRTALSEGEKKMVTYLPLFAAVAASCDGLAALAPDALRFLLLDDAFNKVSEDNHGKLFGLLVELDLDFIVTSERLWGTHDTVPELAITEVIRDAQHETILLEHSHWNGRRMDLVR